MKTLLNESKRKLGNRHVLVTGGAGFIGSHLVREILEAFCRVTILDNLSFGQTELLSSVGADSRFFKVDIRDKESLLSIFRELRPDLVIHLAALHYIPYCNAHPVETVEVNINGTRNVLECCIRYPPAKFFFASTAAVYPIRSGSNAEDSDVGPIDIYGSTKLVGEELCELFHRRSGVPTIVGRLFNVFGPNETNPHLIPEIITQLKNGARQIQLGNLEPKRDFIHTNDVCRAILSLISHVNDGFHIFNIGSGHQHSVLEIVMAAEEALGEPITVVQEPTRVRASDRAHLLSNIGKIQTQIGWEPQVSLVEGLGQLLSSP